MAATHHWKFLALSVWYCVDYVKHFDTGLIRLHFQPVSAVMEIWRQMGGLFGASGGGNPPLEVSGTIHSVLHEL